MNKTVDLVNEWAKFEECHPDGGIDNFCRYYLLNQKQKEEGRLVGGLVPPTKNILLMKIMGRLVRLFVMYAENAREKTGLKQFEEFNLLNTIFQMGEPRKTEVIYETLNELSTGIDILNRLKENGYIEEKDDPADKRSKRVSLTPEGKKVLHNCYNVYGPLTDMFLKDMSQDDVALCVQLLKGLEIKFSGLWQQHKGKPFDEVYEEVMKG